MRSNRFPAFLLATVIAFAPGCSMVASLTGLADAEAKAEESRTISAALELQNQHLQRQATIAEEMVEGMKTRLVAARIALEAAQDLAVPPEDLAAFEETITDLEGEVALTSALAADQAAAVALSDAALFEQKLKTARAEGASAAWQEKYKGGADLVVAGAGAAGIPGGAPLAQGLASLGLLGALLYGKAKGTIKAIPGQITPLA